MLGVKGSFLLLKNGKYKLLYYKVAYFDITSQFEKMDYAFKK